MSKLPTSVFRYKKIAIIHDAIHNYGGGEIILRLISQIVPNADIYTSVNFVPKKILNIKNPIYTTWMQHVSIVKKYPIVIQYLAPLIWNTIDLHEYDIIISHGGFYLSNLIEYSRNKKSFHIHYSISPPMNIFEPNYRNWFAKILLDTKNRFLQQHIRSSMETIPTILAVSAYTQKLISKYYKRYSNIVYPPMEPAQSSITTKKKKKYFCYIGRLDNGKNLDLLVQAFNINKLPLVIAGVGSQEKELKKSANPNIHFYGFANKKQKGMLLSSSIAFIHPAINDLFPLAPREALYQKVPVIAHNSGGMKEIIRNRVTGLFFDENTPESLNKTLDTFQSMNVDRNKCFQYAKKFTTKRFKQEFRHMLLSEYEKFIKI